MPRYSATSLIPHSLVMVMLLFLFLSVSVLACLAGAVGDGCGEFAFCVVGVAGAGELPVVDHGDVGEVLGWDAERGHPLGEPVRLAVAAQGLEGGGVGAGLGEEVAAEPEHVCPAPQVEVLVLLQLAEVPGGLDHAPVVVGDP